MQLASSEILKRLGRGESIASVCAAAAISPNEFDSWWQAECQSRVPSGEGVVRAGVGGAVEIVRDERGIPHIRAERDDDLFFGYGYAMAQDRLFQLDYLRRRAWGGLAEILGPEAVPLDLVAHTVQLGRIAAEEWAAANEETRRLLTAFADGVNTVIDSCAQRPPIEFDLLDYRPTPWSGVDCLAIAGEFRWYLTGRLPILAVPELVRRRLGDGPLYRAFLHVEADDECIVPRGLYPAERCGAEPAAGTGGDPTPGVGSNNWVLGASRSTTGRPLLASDPHIAFAAVSCWYEVHLCGGSFNVAGMTYVGMPAVMFGRNEHVAWGCTNNLCSQRDMYQERTDPAHPGCFLFDGRWEPAERRDIRIEVRGGEPVFRTILESRHGPIVDELLPEALRGTGPVSLRWLGAEPCRWLEALLAMARSKRADELREATRPWRVPTFCVVFCDARGHIGYQAVGRVPIRKTPNRGYRPGWDPEHDWQGLVPFDGMPRLADPPRGFAVTANNRPAPDDFPYPLAGVWPSGHRARRIRQMIESRDKHSRDDLGAMQRDDLSLRALECVPRVTALLADDAEPRVRQAVELLRGWDGRMKADSAAAAIFDVFFAHWCQAVAGEYFEGEAAALVAAAAGGLAARLLEEDAAGWFAAGRRERAIRQSFRAALDTLATRLSSDPAAWAWGQLHRMQRRHVLSGRGDLGALVDHQALPVGGDLTTVGNTGNDPQWLATIGAGYRMLVDMAVEPPEMWAVDAGSASGHPGSPHYDDQIGDWLAGRYHRLPLERSAIDQLARRRVTLEAG